MLRNDQTARGSNIAAVAAAVALACGVGGGLAGCASDGSDVGGAVVSVNGESEPTETPAADGQAVPSASIIGTWALERADGCEVVYPSVVEFVDGGIYTAPSGPDEGAVLHGGDWELDGDTLAMQANNDAMLRYRVSDIGSATFIVVDADGCEIEYTRIAN